MTVAPLLELGGAGPLLHLACANGFPPEAYRNLATRLAQEHRVIALPPRALWPGAGPPPGTPGTWAGLGEDLVRGLVAHRLDPVLGVGHSFGCVATLLAAVRAPRMFRGLVLLDPTIVAPAVMSRLAEDRASGVDFRPRYREGALKRRARFPSREAAFDYWRAKSLFGDWPDTALHDYVRATLEPEGTDWVLRWTPEWEAWYYASYHTETWAELARLPGDLPLLVVRGARSDTYLREAERHFQAVRPGATFLVMEGQGHLFPLAAPEATAAMVQQWTHGAGR